MTLQEAYQHLLLYAQEASAIFPNHYKDTRCLNSTRVFLEVARHFGIEARPVVVKAMACNRAYWRLWTSGGIKAVNEAFLDPRTRERHKPYMVEIEDEKQLTAEGWPGHLIAIATIADKAYLVDSAFENFTRPRKRIFGPSILIALVDLPLNCTLGLDEGCVAAYKETDRQDFRDCPGFKLTEGNQVVVCEVLSAMARKLV